MMICAISQLQTVLIALTFEQMESLPNFRKLVVSHHPVVLHTRDMICNKWDRSQWYKYIAWKKLFETLRLAIFFLLHTNSTKTPKPEVNWSH